MIARLRFATAADPSGLKSWLSANEPQLHVLSIGHAIQVYNDEGTPAELTELAKTYLPTARASRVLVLPTAKAAGAPTGKEGAAAKP